VRRAAPTVLYLTPPVLRALAGAETKPLPGLRAVVVDNAGDLLSLDVSLARTLAAECQIVSAYGTALTGVPLAVYAIPDPWSVQDAPLRVPIGHSVDGTPVTLRNPAGRPTAPGEIGEICAGIHAGQLGRHRPDGTLQTLVRSSSNAHGVSLGDPLQVVAALRDLPEVADAVVTGCAETDRRAGTIAYVASRDISLDGSALCQRLATQLPERQIPQQVVVLGRLPLTPDGDYDLAALPDPGCEGPPADTYVPPRTPTERQLTAIFEDLLSTRRIGIVDTFFELHGFSLLATQLASRVRDEFAVDLSLRQIFESPTIEGLAQIIVDAQIQGTEISELEALLDQLE